MSGSDRLAGLLELEQAAWGEKTNYGEAVRSLFDRAAALADPGDRAEAVLALADAVLSRREAPVAAVGAAALALVSQLNGAPPSVVESGSGRLSSAWRRLAEAAAAAPDSIAAGPELPFGALLPQGADPAEIDDPVLRDRARAAEAAHREAARRWNEGQAALALMRELDARLPPELRRRIEGSG